MQYLSMYCNVICILCSDGRVKQVLRRVITWRIVYAPFSSGAPNATSMSREEDVRTHMVYTMQGCFISSRTSVELTILSRIDGLLCTRACLCSSAAGARGTGMVEPERRASTPELGVYELLLGSGSARACVSAGAGVEVGRYPPSLRSDETGPGRGSAGTPGTDSRCVDMAEGVSGTRCGMGGRTPPTGETPGIAGETDGRPDWPCRFWIGRRDDIAREAI